MRFVLAVLLATPVAAQAASTAALLLGAGLSIEAPCARHVTIMPDATLHGVAAIRATAEHQEEIDRLVLESHDKVEIGTVPAGCWQPHSGVARTLDISVRVPAAYPIDIDEAGAGNYAIGAVGGPLRLDISGAADIDATAAAALSIDISGAGAVTVARAQGAAGISISGHGRVSIGQAVLPKLDADLSGAGALAITGGSIGTFALDSSGVGSVEVGAVVGDAQVDVSGLGAVRLVRVTGSLKKEVSGLAAVSVGQ